MTFPVKQLYRRNIKQASIKFKVICKEKQDWVAFMSQPYWFEVKIEVELRLILRLRLKCG